MRSDVAILFAGPTLHGLPQTLLRKCPFTVMSPAKRGDIEQLAREHLPGRIVIVDGVFHNYPAVGHRELRQAIEKGWEIWGLASMGAIRAAELLAFGMRGFGEVFNRYARDERFTDDEVTLLHEPSMPFEPISEPLIHIRELLHALVAEDAMRSNRAEKIVSALREVWFGYRTLTRLKQLTREISGESVLALDAKLRDIDRYRIKTLDLQRFLEQQPWETR